jgi:hypothetical protein
MGNCQLLTLFGPKLDAEIAVLVWICTRKLDRPVITPHEINPDLLGVPSPFLLVCPLRCS